MQSLQRTPFLSEEARQSKLNVAIAITGMFHPSPGVLHIESTRLLYKTRKRYGSLTTIIGCGQRFERVALQYRDGRGMRPCTWGCVIGFGHRIYLQPQGTWVFFTPQRHRKLFDQPTKILADNPAQKRAHHQLTLPYSCTDCTALRHFLHPTGHRSQ